MYCAILAVLIICVADNALGVNGAGQQRPVILPAPIGPGRPPNPDCLLPVDKGPCRARKIRYHFDRLSGVCKQFDYSGCGGNKNNFPSEAQCLAKCRR
ncbi:hypothetical protein SprV_0501881000 [Sparganum proliferum]